MKKWVVLFGILALVVLLVLSFMITGSLVSSSESRVKTVEKTTEPTQSDITQNLVASEDKSPSSNWIAFLLLAIILVLVIIQAYKEKRGPSNGPVQWKDVWSQPVFIAIAGVTVLNTLASLFIYHAWYWFWNQHTLFWSTNMGTILFVHFKTKRETYAQYVATGIGLLILLGFATPIYKGLKSGSDSKPDAQLARLASSTQVRKALIIIGEAESPGEPGGRQFDEKGNVVRGKVDKDDTGALQINKRIHADLLKEHPEINIEKSKEDNYRFGEILVQKFGFEPWAKTRSIWGPKLAALGYDQKMTGPQIVGDFLVLEAPVGTFGGETIIPQGTYFDWRGSEGAFIVQDQKGSVAKYDPSNGVFERLPYPSERIAFKALGEKPVEVKLRLGKQPF